MEEGRGKWKADGMVRSVMILDNAIIAIQLKRIARQSGLPSQLIISKT